MYEATHAIRTFFKLSLLNLGPVTALCIMALTAFETCPSMTCSWSSYVCGRPVHVIELAASSLLKATDMCLAYCHVLFSSLLYV